MWELPARCVIWRVWCRTLYASAPHSATFKRDCRAGSISLTPFCMQLTERSRVSFQLLLWLLGVSFNVTRTARAESF